MLHEEVGDDVGDGRLAGGGAQIVRDWPVCGDDRPGGGGGCGGGGGEERSEIILHHHFHLPQNMLHNAAIANQLNKMLSSSSAHLRV